MPSPTNGKRDSKILERELSALSLGQSVLLDAVEIPSGTGRLARLFFKSGTRREGLDTVSQSGKTNLHNYGGAPVLDAEIDGGHRTVAVRVDGSQFDISLHPDETELFAGLNVLAAVRNGETVIVGICDSMPVLISSSFNQRDDQAVYVWLPKCRAKCGRSRQTNLGTGILSRC